MTLYLTWSMLGLAIGSAIVHFLSRVRENNLRSQKDSETINKVLFFPDKEFPCHRIVSSITKLSEHKDLCRYPSCRKLHGRKGEAHSSMIEFLRYLTQAKKSIDLCIFLFTQSTLADALFDLHKSNVRVRVITDSSEDDASDSKLERLRSAGIEIKSNKKYTGALMHHKFVILDDEILLTGSFNWTAKAVVSNYEAVLVTSESKLVEPFKDQFERMWQEFQLHTRK